MKNIILMQSAFFALVVTASVIITNAIFGQIDAYETKLKDKMGKTYIIAQDTLTVVDYSFIEKTLTLSNGVKISETLVE